MPKSPKLMYRIANVDPSRGLWYSPDGTFTGEIHSDLTFCRASALKMPFDENLAKKWSCATETADDLLVWFNLEEIEQLEKHGFYVAIYSATEYKTYQFSDPKTGIEIEHLIFKNDSTKLVELVTVDAFRKMLSV